jgi:hypothetical protein
MQVLKTSDQKNIEIYDDLLSYSERYTIYNAIKNSYYYPEMYKNNEVDGYFDITKQYSVEDLVHLDLFNSNTRFLIERFTNHNIAYPKSSINPINQRNSFNETLDDAMTLIYYPNVEWHIEWGGYTLFANEDYSEVEHSLFYKPGRFVLFDSSIPYLISSPSVLSPTFRFNFIMHFIKR